LGSGIKKTEKVMNKQEILDKIKRDTGCDDERAEEIFHAALQNGMVKREPNWNFIITFIIYLAVLGTGAWALWQYL
jgi:hypothetical protein